MNIFYLDHDPSIAAAYHCDKHVVKMILESAQMLSTAHWVGEAQASGITDLKKLKTRVKLSSNAPVGIYAPTHVSHPSSIWTRSSTANYDWLASLAKELCLEYTRRYGRKHKTQDLIERLIVSRPSGLSTAPFVEPPQCMPDHCKVQGDSVSAYRKYYMSEKRKFAKWKTQTPHWWI